MKGIDFWKMHGLGNDFVIIDCIDRKFKVDKAVVRRLAHRNLGIGFDQLLLVQRSKIADFKYSIYNADGNRVEQCGNGARCFAQFVYRRGMTKRRVFRAETRKEIIELRIIDDSLVEVNMGPPIFKARKIPFFPRKSGKLITHRFDFNGRYTECNVLSMGNPHCVIFMDSLNDEILEELGEHIQGKTDHFPEGVNVTISEVIDERNIKLRTYERGVGRTLACGTAACATAVAAIKRNFVRSTVNLHFEMGSVRVEYRNRKVLMTAPATFVFKGKIQL